MWTSQTKNKFPEYISYQPGVTLAETYNATTNGEVKVALSGPPFPLTPPALSITYTSTDISTSLST